MINKSKVAIFRIPEALKNLAYQSIMARAIKKNLKPESFSEYLRRLISEDHEKTKNILIDRISNG